MATRKASAGPRAVPQKPAKKTEVSGEMPHKAWTGTLSFGMVSVPVVMYTAARELGVEFHQYHGACKSQIKQLGLFCPVCSGLPPDSGPDLLDPKQALGEIRITNDSIVRGHPIERIDAKTNAAVKDIIVVTDDDMDKIKPQSAKIMEILEFVPADQVDPIYLDSSFYMAADPKGGGQNGFGLLRAAMIQRKVVAIAKIVKGRRENIAIIRQYGKNGMMAYTAWMADEIQTMHFPELLETRPAELAVAYQLVDALTEKWNPAKYKNTYLENVIALLESKRTKTKMPDVPKKPVASVEPDMLHAFSASLALVKKQKAKQA